MISAAQQDSSDRVLVIDDEQIVRELLGRMLAARGYAVDEAVNGEDGLTKAKKEEYDVIITDIRMPKMDGFDFIENLKAFNQEIPVIIVTAVGDVQNAVRAVRSGAYDFIHKPFGKGDELWNTVARAVELKRTRLENREYHRRLEEINKRLLRELELARRVQETYAAKALVPDEGLDVAGLYEPCFDVGGDLYGAFPIAEGKVALYMADVSGHGPSAALITAMTKVHIDSIADRKDAAEMMSAPERVLTELDRALRPCCAEAHLFVALFCAVVDCRAGKLAYSNAGQCYPILRGVNADSAVFLDQSKGVPLGTGLDLGYFGAVTEFSAGDTLVLYTDGLVEASDPDGNRYDRTRLAHVVETCSGVPAEQVVQEIHRSLEEFSRGVPPHDDVALLVARRNT